MRQHRAVRAVAVGDHPQTRLGREAGLKARQRRHVLALDGGQPADRIRQAVQFIVIHQQPKKPAVFVTAIRDGLKGTKDIRDDKKTELTTAQQAFAAAASNNYAAFSSAVDAIAGALGKATPLGKQALNYRKHLNATTTHTPPEPTLPVTGTK